MRTKSLEILKIACKTDVLRVRERNILLQEMGKILPHQRFRQFLRRIFLIL